ncbi:MAG: adenosylcobinamide-phosphate synthase CbiB [Acidimicrobiales bacterium]|jgi:adenosylcobinamide-phosphate synthase
MTVGRGSAIAASVALGIDALVGDEPLRPHPVAIFGRAMTRLERRIWDDRRLPGIGYTLAGVLTAGGGGALLDRLPGGMIAGGYTAVAGRGLWSAAAGVGRALDAKDLPAARRLLPSLVGRDPAGLGSGEIARATVESVAENTVDGIVAPALWGAVGGAAGALAYRAVNTLDSMVGYRDERYEHFGWASARLDDLANFVPARLTVALVTALRPRSAGEIWRAVREEAPAHPSPNAGVAEAAFAAALGVRLGGTNSYRGQAEHRATAGAVDGRAPLPSDIGRAVALSRQVAWLLAGTLAVAGALGSHRSGES